MDELKEIADKLREKITSGVGLLYSVIDDKIALVAVVSDDLVKDKNSARVKSRVTLRKSSAAAEAVNRTLQPQAAKM